MPSEPVKVFLDGNVLAKPVTRTLLIVGAAHQRSFLPVWSRHAEAEGDRHLRPGMKPVSDLRRVFGWTLSAAGSGAEQYSATRASDRQIIADTVEAGARFILTEDVDDFAAVDLAAVRLSAVNPDLFMSHRLSREDYLAALRVLIHNRRRPPSTLADIHAAIAKQHPLLFGAHADLFPVLPTLSSHNPPGELFRGVRCIRCGRVLTTAQSIGVGLGPACRSLA